MQGTWEFGRIWGSMARYVEAWQEAYIARHMEVWQAVRGDVKGRAHTKKYGRVGELNAWQILYVKHARSGISSGWNRFGVWRVLTCAHCLGYQEVRLQSGEPEIVDRCAHGLVKSYL